MVSIKIGIQLELVCFPNVESLASTGSHTKHLVTTGFCFWIIDAIRFSKYQFKSVGTPLSTTKCFFYKRLDKNKYLLSAFYCEVLKKNATMVKTYLPYSLLQKSTLYIRIQQLRLCLVLRYIIIFYIHSKRARLDSQC